MRITALRTRTLHPPKDDLYAVLDEVLTGVCERSVLALSSKAVSIGEGRCVPIPEGSDSRTYKEELARREADCYLPRAEEDGYGSLFTINRGVLIGSAGIDQSNGNGHLVLWPADPMHAAHELRTYCMKRFGLQELGVIVTDSRSTPFRNGATGFALGYAGFRAQYDYRGTPDLFGRPLRAERMNIADSLATVATLSMGEGNEGTPLAYIEDVPHIEFSETEADDPHLALAVPMDDDVFARFFRHAGWRQGGA